MHKKWAKEQTGFTLVELLIVIVVIAILAAISIVSYNGIQERTRDAIRKSDINALAKALEIDYVNNGTYTQPELLCTDTSVGGMNVCGVPNVGDWHTNSDLRKLIAQGIITKLPVDPINDTTYKYSYEPWNAGQGGYTLAGQAYDLCATLEAGGNYCVNARK